MNALVKSQKISKYLKYLCIFIQNFTHVSRYKIAFICDNINTHTTHYANGTRPNAKNYLITTFIAIMSILVVYRIYYCM